MALRRRYKIVLAVLAVLVVGLAGFTYFILAYALGVIYRPAGSMQLGAYTIKSQVTEGFGHTAHRQTLFLGNYRVADWLGESTVSPHDPAKILYSQWCDPDDDQKDCGIFYFNGATRRKWKIAPSGKSFSAGDNTWSVDGRVAILDLNIGQELAFVDLGTGRVTPLKVGPNTERPPWRGVYFRGWSPDFQAAAVEVVNQWQGVGPDAIYDFDLYNVDPYAGVVAYVGSVHRQKMPITAEHRWQQSGKAYRLVLDSSYRKPEGEFLTF